MSSNIDSRGLLVGWFKRAGSWFQSWLLEPVNALTHFTGAVGAALGTLLLLYLTRGETGKMLSLAVYGLTIISLYTASTLFHGIKLSEGRRMWLNRLDHGAIFLLIAGTYTPIAYNLFPRPASNWILIGIWLMAFAGVAYKLLSPRIHGLFNASVYPGLAWAGALPLLLLSRGQLAIPPLGVALLILGGLVYMAGFFIYYWQKPDPWPEVFGHHEIWHLFVMGGSFSHYLFMLFIVVPYSR